MPTSITFSAYIGLIFLGIRTSLCLGLENLEFLSQLTDAEDYETTGITPNLRLLEEVQQCASKLNNGYENLVDDRGSARKKRGIAEPLGASTDTNIQKMEIKTDLEIEGDRSKRSSEKRLSQSRRNVDVMGFKSRPGFRSWGGKRSKFATWGGKRGKFNNWGGKRDIERINLDESDDLISRIFKSLDPANQMEKKMKGNNFHNWGGKRSKKSFSLPNFASEPQNKFSQWDEKKDLEYAFGNEQPYPENDPWS